MTKPDLSAIMASYTAKVNAEAKRRQQMIDAQAAGTLEIEFPSWGPAMGQWGEWNISDRH